MTATVDQFAVTTGTVPSGTTPYTFDVTHSDITTWSTKGAAMIVLSGHVSGGLADHARIAIAMIAWDGSSASADFVCTRILHDSVIQETRTRPEGVDALGMLDPSAITETLEISFSSALTNGVRLQVDTDTETGFQYEAFLFASSSDAEVDSGIQVAGSSYTSAPAAMDLYAFVTFDGTINSTTTQMRPTLGFVVDDGSLSQACMSVDWPRQVPGGTSSGTVNVHNDRVGAANSVGDVECTAIASNGFTTVASAGALDLLFLGIKFADADRTCAVAVEDIPDNASGTESFTGLGLKPEVCIAAMGLFDGTPGTAQSDNRASSFHVGMFSGSDEANVGVSHKIGITLNPAPTECYSYFLDEAFFALTRVGTGLVGYRGTLEGFTASGFDVAFVGTVPSPLTSDPQPGSMVVLGISAVDPLEAVDESVFLNESVGVSFGRGVDEDVHVDEETGSATAPGVFLDSAGTHGDTAQGGSARGATGRGGSVAGGTG